MNRRSFLKVLSSAATAMAAEAVPAIKLVEKVVAPRLTPSQIAWYESQNLYHLVWKIKILTRELPSYESWRSDVEELRASGVPLPFLREVLKRYKALDDYSRSYKLCDELEARNKDLHDELFVCGLKPKFLFDGRFREVMSLVSELGIKPPERSGNPDFEGRYDEYGEEYEESREEDAEECGKEERIEAPDQGVEESDDLMRWADDGGFVL